jgi:hypothetical protein
VATGPSACCIHYIIPGTGKRRAATCESSQLKLSKFPFKADHNGRRDRDAPCPGAPETERALLITSNYVCATARRQARNSAILHENQSTPCILARNDSTWPPIIPIYAWAPTWQCTLRAFRQLLLVRILDGPMGAYCQERMIFR